MLLLMFLIVPKKSTILNRVAITTLCDFFIITEQFIIFGHDHCIIARTILDLGTIIVSSHALSYIRARSLYHRTHCLIFGHDHCIIARTILYSGTIIVSSHALSYFAFPVSDDAAACILLFFFVDFA